MKVAVVITQQPEIQGMVHWAVRFARALHARTTGEPQSPYEVTDQQETAPDDSAGLTVLVGGGVKTKAVRAEIDRWQLANGMSVAADFFKIEGEGDQFVGQVVDQVDELGIELLVVGKNRFPGVDSDKARAQSRELYDRAPCNTLLLRLGDGALGDCRSVLVPSAGGRHSLAALRLGHCLVKGGDGKMTPLYVERGIALEDGAAVGELVLLRVLREAGIDAIDDPQVDCQVSTCSRVDAGIRQALEAEDYDLLVVGSANSGGLKRKLFGTVPDRLLEGEQAMAVAAIRARRPTAQRIREKFERFLRLRVPQLSREERVALFERLQTGSRWNFDFMTLITLATAIAALGLVLDSTAVVIGAMLVAPLMTPLLGAGLALVQGNLPLMRTCLQAVIFGFLAAILVGIVIGAVAPLTQLTSELAARGGVRLEDMLVAFLSGVAASYCIARPGLSSALAGVAIAAALVPPIATVGISLALSAPENAWGAAKLFGVNVVAIVLGAALNFYLAGIRASGAIGWVRRTAVFLSVCAICLLVSLAWLLVPKLSERLLSSRDALDGLEMRFAEILREEADLGFQELAVLPLKRNGEQIGVRCEVTAARHPSDSMVRDMARAASEELVVDKGEIELRVTTRLSTILKAGALSIP
jgi:uncharacterized hydrophobic protein (TIGR00271 family)